LFGPGATLGGTFDADRSNIPGADPVHQGLDVIMKIGSPVRAPLDLLILEAGSGSKAYQGGRVLALDRFKREWYFGHLHNIVVKKGQSIAKGTIMGYIGSEKHVHVQLKEGVGGQIIDPSAALNDAATGVGSGSDINGPDRYDAQAYPGTQAATYSRMGSAGGAAYGTAFTRSLQANLQPIPITMVASLENENEIRTLAQEASRAPLAMMSRPPSASPTGAVQSGGAGERGAPQAVNINLSADVMMDGEKVGTLVAPRVDAIIGDQFSVEVTVSDSVYKPGTAQSAFRTP